MGSLFVFGLGSLLFGLIALLLFYLFVFGVLVMVVFWTCSCLVDFVGRCVLIVLLFVWVFGVVLFDCSYLVVFVCLWLVVWLCGFVHYLVAALVLFV